MDLILERVRLLPHADHAYSYSVYVRSGTVPQYNMDFPEITLGDWGLVLPFASATMPQERGSGYSERVGIALAHDRAANREAWRLLVQHFPELSEAPPSPHSGMVTMRDEDLPTKRLLIRNYIWEK